MISARRSAVESLMRTGILDSPNPGSNITMALTRANTSRKAAARTGKSEISMRIRRMSRLEHSHPAAAGPIANAQSIYFGRAIWDLAFANATRGQTGSERQIHRATHDAISRL